MTLDDVAANVKLGFLSDVVHPFVETRIGALNGSVWALGL